MKKLLFIGLGSALLVTLGGVGSAQADAGPHIGYAQTAFTTGVQIAQVGAGRCAACHRAHTAKAEYLLKQAQPQLCYSCHSSGAAGSATDVANGVDADTQGALRGGGFNFAAIGSDLASKDMGAQKSYGVSSTNQKIPVLGYKAAIGTLGTAGYVPAVNSAPAPTNSRHQIDGATSGTAWGNGPIDFGSAGRTANVGNPITLECGSCHDPHGNKNYRILRPIPVDAGLAQKVVVAAVPAVTTWTDSANPPVVHTLPYNDLSVNPPVLHSPVDAIPAVYDFAPVPVVIPDATAKVYTTTNYWLAGDSYVPAGGTAYTSDAYHPVVTAGTVGGTDGYIQNVASWCTTCHTRYLAPTKSYKTTSGDATFMYRHRSDANYAAGAANCITCHVSHGSNAVMTGYSQEATLPDGSTTTGVADSKLLRVNNRGTCLMCHNV